MTASQLIKKIEKEYKTHERHNIVTWGTLLSILKSIDVDEKRVATKQKHEDTTITLGKSH